MNNLAVDLWTHYEHTGDVQLLTEVISLNREALHLTPTDSPHHNASLANLATALKSKDMRLLLENTPAHVLHMACHGVHDEGPLKSALVLHDGRLTIEDIMHLSLPRAVLAYLSACHTAKGDQNAPDQAVHLAASMLFCGFRSVIGTMW
jgi:CHAT domain-containing protein